MKQYICVGADVHDRSLVLKLALGLQAPEKLRFGNTPAGRARMIREFRNRSQAAGGAEVVLAYEASGQGFGLYDELTEAGIRCYVLAPTRIARSPRQKRDKTDERDAELLLQLVRGHVLANNELPAVWIPDAQTRDDREPVRARLDTMAKLTRIKTQIRCLLKRNQVRCPEEISGRWTHEYRAWLKSLSESQAALAVPGPGGRIALGSLLRQLASLEAEIVKLDQAVAALSRTPRYAGAVQSLESLMGVGVLTAMVFLTEMGDLSRFRNRRQVAGYLGLVPSKAESGETDDRKGHITRQGPGRVRKVLCQASWARVNRDPQEATCYRRIVQKNPKHKKIALVASMRRLGVRMWHRGLRAQQEAQKTSVSGRRAVPVPSSPARSGYSTGPHRSAAAATSDELEGPILDRRRSERRGPALKCPR